MAYDTNIPVQQMADFAAGDQTVTFTAADDVNDHYFINNGRCLLIMRNTSGGILTATVVSVANNYGRSGDLTISCPATTGVSIVGPFPKHLWNQSTGRVHVGLTDDTNVDFAVISLPVKEG